MLGTKTKIIILVLISFSFGNANLHGEAINIKMKEALYHTIIENDIINIWGASPNDTVGIKLCRFKKYVEDNFVDVKLPIYLTPVSAVGQSAPVMVESKCTT